MFKNLNAKSQAAAGKAVNKELAAVQTKNETLKKQLGK